ncbi:hypothetical protein [Microbulbifer hainanensis]|uniref:hypothetical protein n=1 Tax=Microbulbifer hainanensis TaxID=2735675 RepID=UPI00186969E3|nr:hypothetical protein [Microbulbifer hainanensis]
MLYRSLVNRISLAAALFGAATAAIGDEKYTQAQDMAYGVALYDYFQGNYFDALSTLMVAGQRGSIRVHADNAELIEGGISLGFGMQQRAADLFTRQLEKADGDPESLARYRHVAWLKLAELTYRQQNWSLSTEYLQNSGAAAETPLAVNLALRGGDIATAQQRLENLDKDRVSASRRVLAQINIAAALARAQRYGEAVRYYQLASALAVASDASSEIEILRDRTHIGAGYAFALQQRYAQALEEFRRVRLHTAWADRALLGMSWAAINSGEYQTAVDALQFLRDRNSNTPAAREALVALPFSYEKLQRPKAALVAYQQAEQQYRASLSELQQLVRDVSALQFVPTQDTDIQRYGWLQLAETPSLLRDNRRYLHHILESDAFQLRLSELRDLQQLAQVIDRWQQRLPLFDQLIADRKQRRRNIVDGYNSAQYDQQVEIAQQQYRALESALTRIQDKRDFLALLRASGGTDAKTLARIEDAEARYRKLAPRGMARDTQATSLERARGILLWRASEQYHENLWQQRKTLSGLDKQIQLATARQRKVEQIAQRAPQLQQLQNKVESATPRLAKQRDAIADATATIEASIRRDVLAALNRERSQIQQYMAHSRLAIARLQDSALQAAPAAPVLETGNDDA